MTSKFFKIENGILTKYTGKDEMVIIPLGVRKIGYQAFQNNHFVRCVEFSFSVDSICDSAFYGCRNLNEIRLPKFLKKIGAFAFADCTQLYEVRLPDSLKIIEPRAFKNCKRLTKINIPEITIVKGGAFHGCNLSEVDFGNREDFTTINDSGLRATANRCILCGSKMDPAEDGSGMHCLGCNHTFSWASIEEWENFVILDGICTQHIRHGGLIPHGVTKISMGAFDDSVVPDLTIPDSVTEIGTGAFLWCDFALSLYLPRNLHRLENDVLCGSNISWLSLPENLEYLGEGCLAGCDNLSELVITDNIRCISEAALNSCEGLRTVQLGSSVQHIGKDAFSQCTILKEITCPSNLESISEGAFRGCEDLSSVVLNQGLICIGERAFESCTQLTSIKIPDTVLSIGVGAFVKCPALHKALIPESLRYINLESIFDTHTEIEFYAA